MRSATAAFRRTMSQRRNFVNYADMTLSDGTVLHLAPEDFRIGGNTIRDDVVDGSAFTVGTAIGKTVTIALDNSSEFFSQFNFYGARFVLYVGLEVDETPTRVEKIRIGIFTVITPATTGMVITMEAVDNMYKFDRLYSESSLQYPATLKTIIADACVTCGVTDGTGEFDRWNMTVTQRPENDVTFRQVISYVTQIACANAKISDMGSLIFSWYTDTVPEQYVDGGNFRRVYKQDGSYLTGDELDGGTFAYNDADEFDGGLFTDAVAFHDLGFAKSVQVGTDDIVITGVRVKNGDTEYLQGTDDYCINIEDNPLTVGYERTVAQAVYAKLFYLTFRPFSLSYLQDPTIESGDWVIITDVLGNGYFTFCTSVSFTVGSYMSISCNAESPAQQFSTYSSQAASAIVKESRRTEKTMSTYDVAVQRMNALAANAMGMFTYEHGNPVDGSSYYYMSNKPIIDNEGTANFTVGSKVWKLTGDGFFICQSAELTDDECAWTAGWDSENNVVVNTLSTIGLSFDWAYGGTLTLGGQNNQNGVLVIRDAVGTEIGRWDNTGLTTVYTYTYDDTPYQRGFKISNGSINYIPPTGSTAQAYISMSSVNRSSSLSFNRADMNLYANNSIDITAGLNGVGISSEDGGTVWISAEEGLVSIEAGDGDVDITASEDLDITCNNIYINTWYGKEAGYTGSIVSDWETIERVTFNLEIDSQTGAVQSFSYMDISIPSSFYSATKGLIIS